MDVKVLKNNGLVLLTITPLVYRHWSHSSLRMDGLDGNRLQLKKLARFFHVPAMYLRQNKLMAKN